MVQPLRVEPSEPRPGIAADEWEARVNLAACYRLVELHGWGEGIYNHIAMRVPGEPSKFLVKNYAITYDEVTASNLVKVDMHADLNEKDGVNRPGFTLHSAVLRGRDDVNCSLHLHTDVGIAMAAHAGELRMISQNAIRFYKRLGYHDYEGLTENFDERDRVVRSLGKNRAVVLRNHGLLTVGVSPREAFVLIKDLLSACHSQLMLEAAGADMVEIPTEVCDHVARQYETHDKGRGAADWPAWLRRLDRIDASYST